MTVLGTPYRLGATSYVWPAGILPNVSRLGPLVDDVELVLFEVEDDSNLPDAATIARLQDLAERHDLTYTVHLPLDLAMAHPPSLEKAERAIACTRELSPRAYVLHLDGRAVEGNPERARLACWREDACRLLRELVAMAGDARRLCVENLENYAPEYFLPLLRRIPVELCVDVGHLWLAGRNPLVFLEDHLACTCVVHLHGVGERDHQSLRHQGVAQVAPVLDLLSARRYDGVVTLEVFGRRDFFASRSIVVEILNGRG
jgi:sugar phosphate isomerase/epimerase